jgi:hypothetical protein
MICRSQEGKLPKAERIKLSSEGTKKICRRQGRSELAYCRFLRK